MSSIQLIDYKLDTTDRRYTPNNTWYTISGTDIDFVAEDNYFYKFTFMEYFKFDRFSWGFQLLRCMVDEDILIGGQNPIIRRTYDQGVIRSFTSVYYIENLDPGEHTVYMQANNSNTGNYMYFYRTAVMLEKIYNG